MPIREKGYYNWDGDLKQSHVKWLPIFINGIKSVFKKRFSKAIFAMTGFNFVLFLVALYVSTKPELRMMKELVRQIQTDADLFNTFYTNGYLLFWMLVTSIFAGAELISNDLKFNSFTLYLSRPLSRLDYVLGKFSVVLFYLLLFSLVPGVLLMIAKLIFTGSFTVSPQLFLAAVVFPILVSLFLASLTILLSSLTPNSRFVKIMIFVVYLMSNGIANMFREIFKEDAFYFLAINKNIEQFGQFIFGTRSGFYTNGLISGIILVSLTALFFAIVIFRIKRVEV